LEQGEFPLILQPVMLHEVLTPAEQDVQEELTRKGLRLSREGNDSLTVTADPAQLRRIFTALLRNAVQYTERGGVTISCCLQEERVVVTIADTGVGIQPAGLGQLFAKPKLGTLLRGRGLSLYVSRMLAKAMGGDVTLVSTELETGSTFAVIFPQAGKAQRTHEPTTPAHHA
jgi:signal transduction histidine kinase